MEGAESPCATDGFIRSRLSWMTWGQSRPQNILLIEKTTTAIMSLPIAAGPRRYNKAGIEENIRTRGLTVQKLAYNGSMTGAYIGIDLATLQTMLAEAQTTRTAILKAHQSYSIAGRSFTRAPLESVTKEIGEISYAIRLAGGTVQRVTYADMSNGP